MVGLIFLQRFTSSGLALLIFFIFEFGEVIILCGWVFVSYKWFMLANMLKLGVVFTSYLKNYPVEDMDLKS